VQVQTGRHLRFSKSSDYGLLYYSENLPRRSNQLVFAKIKVLSAVSVVVNWLSIPIFLTSDSQTKLLSENYLYIRLLLPLFFPIFKPVSYMRLGGE